MKPEAVPGFRWLVGWRPDWVMFLAATLPLILLLPGSAGFPYPPQAGSYSDAAISHYPAAVFIQQELFAGQGLPLWSPRILSGYPFIANPLSGLWYPPLWPAWLLPLPFGINLAAIVHLSWLAIGVYRLLRAEGLPAEASLFGALAAGLAPKLYGHFGAGHLSLVMAAAWLPWLLAAARRPPRPPAAWGWLDGAAICQAGALALTFLADPRMVAYAAPLWAGYALVQRRPLRELFQTGILAALLAAPAWLPFIEYVSLSTRAALTGAAALEFSLAPPRYLRLVYPEFGGFYEWIVYPGAAALLLAAAAILLRPGRMARFWLTVMLAVLALACGSYLPGMERLSGLPGLSLLRVPPRVWFAGSLGVAALAAYGMEALSRPLEARVAARLRLAWFIAGALALLAGVGLAALSAEAGFAWGGVVWALAALLAWLYLGGRLPRRAWLAAMFAVLLLDLGAVDRSLVRYRPAQEVLAEGAQAAAYLAQQPGPFRVYSPSYSLPQQIAALYRLELADGIDPLQNAAYAEFMGRASGVPQEGYSVTLPGLKSGNPAVDNAGYTPDADRLGLLNVAYVAAAYDLNVEGLQLERQFGETRLYRNRYNLPPIYLRIPSDQNAFAIDPDQIKVDTPNRIQLTVRGEGDLVFAEVNMPGWRCWVDGKPSAIEPYAELLRRLRLDAGEHTVECRFLPTSLLAGLLGLLAGLVWISASIWKGWRG